MKFQVLSALLCFLTVSRAQEITIPVGIDGRDSLTVLRTQDSEGNYDVGYNENQYTGGASFMREKGTATGRKEGSYGYTTRNGLIRIVTYVADENGYRAEVLTNEPGVIAANPSNVKVTKEKEPDPDSLTTPKPQTARETGQVFDHVKNYVVASSSSYTGQVYSPSNHGSAQMMFISPHAQYNIGI